jgi:hypothetical protein
MPDEEHEHSHYSLTVVATSIAGLKKAIKELQPVADNGDEEEEEGKEQEETPEAA